MALFGRRKRDAVDADEAVDAVDAAEPVDESETGPDDPRGPWDVEEVPDGTGRIDLGALRIPPRPGMKVKMEKDRGGSQRIVAVNVLLEESALQLAAFAAPRTAGLWEELREELATSIGKQGGSVEEQDGPYGVELLARLPVRTDDGRSGHRPARFIGIDGPRWFLRAVINGKALVDADAAAAVESVLDDVVVVRGHEARAPRDLLGLHMPGKPGQEPTSTGTMRPSIDLGSPRGPEITEVR